MYSHMPFVSCGVRRKQIKSAACRSGDSPLLNTFGCPLPSVRFPEFTLESCTYGWIYWVERPNSSGTSSTHELGLDLVTSQSDKSDTKSKRRGDYIVPLSESSSVPSWTGDFWTHWPCPTNLVWLFRSWCWQIMTWNLVCKFRHATRITIW